MHLNLAMFARRRVVLTLPDRMSSNCNSRTAYNTCQLVGLPGLIVEIDV